MAKKGFGKKKPKTTFAGNLPYPEILVPDRWEHSEWRPGGFGPPPHAARGLRLIHSPFGREKVDQAIRDHEMLHVRFSPQIARPEALGISKESINAIEDARVNEIGVRFEIDSLKHLADDFNIDENTCPDPTQNSQSFMRTIGLLMALHPTDKVEELEKYLKQRHSKMIPKLDPHGNPVLDEDGKTKMKRRMDPVVRAGINFAAKVLADFSTGRQPSRRKANKYCREFDELCEELFGEHDGLKELRDRAENWRRHARETDEENRHMLKDRSMWGSIEEVERPPLEVKFRTNKAFSSRRATSEGAHFRAPHRVLIDQKVFSTKKRVPGGSLMIDLSGSMSLTREEIQAIMEAAPASVVAGYSGDSGRACGRIRVMAENGRRVRDDLLDSPCGKGNVIDGPALRWLAQLPEPRIWVSDGMVTGLEDAGGVNLIDEILELCKNHTIYRVDNPQEAAEFLNEKIEW